MGEEPCNRRKRVQRLKKVILSAVVALIVIPTVLCVLFAGRSFSLGRAYKGLKESQKELLLEYNALQLRCNELEETLNSQNQDCVEDTVSQDNDRMQGDNAYTPEEIRKVYLTFDDGPSSNTETILDILERYHVKATFFVVGKPETQYLPYYKRIVEEGHTLGMHSYSHKYNEIYQSVQSYEQDLMKLKSFLKEQTGVDCTFVRFPGGSSNTVSNVDMNDLIQYLNGQDLTYFDWNVSSGDAVSTYISADRIVNNCMDGIARCQTAVVLMHDAAEKKTTVEALPRLIEMIQAMDNTVLLPLDSDTTLIQHIQNESEE